MCIAYNPWIVTRTNTSFQHEHGEKWAAYRLQDWINHHVGQMYFFDDFTKCFNFMHKGTAISFVRIGGNIAHWAIYAGENLDGSHTLIHVDGSREINSCPLCDNNKQQFDRVENRKPLGWVKDACVKEDDFLQVADVESLEYMTIYQCPDEVDPRLCGAFSILRANVSLYTKGYNAVLQACQNFVGSVADPLGRGHSGYGVQPWYIFMNFIQWNLPVLLAAATWIKTNYAPLSLMVGSGIYFSLSITRRPLVVLMKKFLYILQKRNLSKSNARNFFAAISKTYFYEDVGICSRFFPRRNSGDEQTYFDIGQSTGYGHG